MLMNQSQALQSIDQLFEKEELDDATRRCAVIVIDAMSGVANQQLLGCHTPDELATWIRRDVLLWQEELSEEAFAERFEVGEGSAYGCIEQMLSCVDYGFILNLLASMRQADDQPGP